MQPVLDFLDGPMRNAWVRVGPFRVYMRKTMHLIDEGMVHTADIANISRVKDKGNRKGEFWLLLQNLEIMLDNRPVRRVIYIENVLNGRLRISLRKRGWREIPTPLPSLAPCMVKGKAKP